MRSPKGVEWEPAPDPAELIGRVMEMEKDGTTLSQLVATMGRGNRLSDADRLLRLCGSSYPEFVNRGFGFDDIVEVIECVYRAVGFTVRPRASPRSTAGA